MWVCGMWCNRWCGMSDGCYIFCAEFERGDSRNEDVSGKDERQGVSFFFVVVFSFVVLLVLLCCVVLLSRSLCV